jgi:hypothetical protein
MSAEVVELDVLSAIYVPLVVLQPLTLNLPRTLDHLPLESPCFIGRLADVLQHLLVERDGDQLLQPRILLIELF